MPELEIWVLITQDGTVSAYDTQDAALNAAIDETDPWVECVTIQGPQRPHEGSRSDEQPAGDHLDRPAPNAQTGVQRIHVPTSLGVPGFYDPWSGGAA